MKDIDDKLRRKGQLCEAVWEGKGGPLRRKHVSKTMAMRFSRKR